MGVLYARVEGGTLKRANMLHVEGCDGLDSAISEFNQMNDKVSAYLAAADEAYTNDNASSVSVISNYATYEGHKDRPLGFPITDSDGNILLQNEKTGDGWTSVVSKLTDKTIHNATPNAVSQYIIRADNGDYINAGRIKPTGRVRMLFFEWDACNSRDLGGWACDGGTVKYGKLFRGGAVQKTAEMDEVYHKRNLQHAEEIGIRRQLEIQGDAESGNRTVSNLGSNVKYERIPLDEYYDYLVDVEGDCIGNVKKVFRSIFDAAVHDEPLYYNCSLGRDRTGTLTLMLLALLGVAEKDIDKDYELSSFSTVGATEGVLYPAYRTGGDYIDLKNYLASFGGNTIRDHVVWWFIKVGFSLAELNAFRAAMIDGTPAELKASAFTTTYTVKHNLTNCIATNLTPAVEAGKNYRTSIVLEETYNHITSVVVTMGGNDVTASVYSNGVVNIPSVTGNVEIKVMASKWINQLALAGYKENTRLNSSGGETAENGLYLTGFIPCTVGDVVRFNKRCNIDTNGSIVNYRICFYDANKNLTVPAAPNWSEYLALGNIETHDNGALKSFTIPEKAGTNGTVAYARFTSYYLDKRCIITVNEEI